MWGMKPTKFFRLGAVDRGLMSGLAFLESHIDATGYPTWLSMAPENQGWFEVERAQNFAQEAIDVARAQGGKLAPGEFLRAVLKEQSAPERANQQRDT